MSHNSACAPDRNKCLVICPTVSATPSGGRHRNDQLRRVPTANNARPGMHPTKGCRSAVRPGWPPLCEAPNKSACAIELQHSKHPFFVSFKSQLPTEQQFFFGTEHYKFTRLLHF